MAGTARYSENSGILGRELIIIEKVKLRIKGKLKQKLWI